MIHHEIAARTGVVVTGAGVTTSFVATAMPYVQLAAAVIGVLVGCATFIYYVMAGIEKWRGLRKKK